MSVKIVLQNRMPMPPVGEASLANLWIDFAEPGWEDTVVRVIGWIERGGTDRDRFKVVDGKIFENLAAIIRCGKLQGTRHPRDIVTMLHIRHDERAHERSFTCWDAMREFLSLFREEGMMTPEQYNDALAKLEAAIDGIRMGIGAMELPMMRGA